MNIVPLVDIAYFSVDFNVFYLAIKKNQISVGPRKLTLPPCTVMVFVKPMQEEEWISLVTAEQDVPLVPVMTGHSHSFSYRI